MTQFNTCLNKEAKIYGLSQVSVIVGGVVFITGIVLFGFLIGAGSGAFGLLAGATFGKKWHVGSIQKFMYWHLGVGKMIPSHKRYFI
jgi:hypothetical protein